jgi:hypothetical protein
MRLRPLSLVVLAVVLGAAVLLTACSRRTAPPPEPHLLAAVFDRDGSRSVEWSHTPQLAIYEDGRFVLRRDEPKDGLAHSYWTGELQVEELQEVNELVRAVAALPSRDSLPGSPTAAFGPETLFVFGGGGSRALRVSLFGRFTGEESEDALELAPAMLRWLVYVRELRATSRPLSPWQPAAMRVRLVRMRPAADAAAWPSSWPAPEPAADSSGVRCEATAPISSACAFRAACGGKRGDVIVWDGKFWRPHLYPALPGVDAWGELMIPSGDEPSPGDLPVWLEAASLIGGADRVWVARETEREPGAVWADRAWIRRFAAAIEQAQLGRGTNCFCIGYRWAQFERAGQPLVWVSAIHGNQLRIYVRDGGGDYKVSSETWQQVNGLLVEAARDGVRRPHLPPELSPGAFPRGRSAAGAN